MTWLAGLIVLALLLLAFLVRRDEAARDARKRNPRPLPYLDEPWGDR